MRAVSLFAIILVLVVARVSAQEAGSSPWDVTKARGTTRTIDFTTTEGTEMSVDISGDGRWIVFDLLGHIYRMPSAGGQAEPLTQNSGVALNYHPRISPDGRLIAFVSDRGGQNNLWVMNIDGSEPRSVFLDRNLRVFTPAWTPDGEYIIVRRTSTSRGTSESELFMYHRDGGTGVRLVDDANAAWPSTSPDGRYLYYMVRDGTGDGLAGHFQIRRFEFATGKRIDITSGTADGAASGRGSSGGAYAPEISPDGRWLAFGRQIPDGTINFKGHSFGPRTALWLHDLETGEQRLLMDPIGLAIESGGGARILPGYSWARDGRSIILSQGGEIRRVDIATGEVTTIPFAARVQRTISERAYAAFRIEDGPFTAKFLRWHTASPDGRQIAFQSIGRIWIADLSATDGGGGSHSSGIPRRLTADDGAIQEFAPTWSPDGQWLAYTTWDDTAGGHLWKIPAHGGTPTQLTPAAGEYVHPSWSPDGSELVLVRGAGSTRHGRSFTANPWWDVVRIAAAGGSPQLVARVALPAGQSPTSQARRAILQPAYGPEGRIFFPERADSASPLTLVSYLPDGTGRREHISLPTADESVPSPDGKWLAFSEGDNVYLTAMPWIGTGGDPVSPNRRGGSLPVRTLSRAGGLFPRWRDATTLEFGSAFRYYRYHTETQRTDTVSITLEVPRHLPSGSVALTDARIVTLRGDEVIERGTVVVQGARIECVGVCQVPSNAQTIDASGKTIIPGWVDMHSHHYREHRGYRPLRDYEMGIYLAYGVTTSLDVSMWSQNIFPTAELIDAGRMIGPRTFSTGDNMTGGDSPHANDITDYSSAEHAASRMISWGAVSLKQYLQPRRDQRQWLSEAARRLGGVMITGESGDIWYNLSMIMDGQTGWEHSISSLPLYGDVTTFLGLAGAFYSPTLVVGGGRNIEYFYGASDVWKDEKQRRWMPWRNLVGHTRRRLLRPTTDYTYPLVAQGMADVISAGGYGAMGSHGEHHGMAPHWEVWMGASALGPLGALKVASLHGAHFLGADQDLGSIERGKLADLIVLNSNPLDDIRNTLDMLYVMKDGVLYESDTLDEIWPERRAFGPYYWVDSDVFKADEIPFHIWKRN
jgi:Tol biopolymer transport system component